MIDFDSQIVTIIHSKTTYSMEMGRGDDIKYDFGAIERIIGERILQMKRPISPQFPIFQFYSGEFDKELFSDVKTIVRQVTNYFYM